MRRCYDWRALRRIARAMRLRARPADRGRLRYVLRHMQSSPSSGVIDGADIFPDRGANIPGGPAELNVDPDGRVRGVL